MDNEGTNLESSLILCSFMRTVVVDLPLGPLSSQTVCSWPDLQIQKDNCYYGLTHVGFSIESLYLCVYLGALAKDRKSVLDGRRLIQQILTQE